MLTSRYILKDIRLVLELTSALTLEMLGKPFLLEKRIVLLHAIKEYGSISKAAKAVPMSYKSAWEAVDTMNSLSPEPIVSRETGGKDGGGTTITTYGNMLLENYALLKEEHSRFLTRLSELTDVQSGTFKTIGRWAMQISARNQIQVAVSAIDLQGIHAKITLKLKSRQLLYAVITQEAVENLQIALEEKVIAIFKSSAVHLREETRQDGENRIEGIISAIEKDNEKCKVVVDIGGHDKIISVLSTATLEHLSLYEGAKVKLEIQMNDIMLGK